MASTRAWHRRGLGLLTGALLVAASAGARAQSQPQDLLEEPRRRQGYYLSLSVLGGNNYVREEGESLGNFTGTNINIRLGQLLTRRLGMGLLINTGSSKKGTQTATLQGLGLEGHVELVRTLAVHAGVGLGVMQLKDSSVKNEELRGAFGAQYNLALSYAFFPFGARKSGGFSLTPMLQARFVPGDNATAVSTMLGLDIGWWTGLPRNQLDLPPEDAYKRE
jgi:hypothetical protein